VAVNRTEDAAKTDFSRRLGYAASLFRENLIDQMDSMRIKAKTLADFDLYEAAGGGFMASTTQILLQNERFRTGLDFVALIRNSGEVLLQEGEPPHEGFSRILNSLCFSPLTSNLFIIRNEPWIFAAAELTRIRSGKERTHVVFAIRLTRDFADKFQRLTGAEFSLLYGGKRILTTLMDVFNKRMTDSAPEHLDAKTGELEVRNVTHTFVREEVLRGKVSDAIYLEISLPKSEYTELGRRLGHDFILFGALGVILALVTGTILAVNIANPIARLADLSNRIGRGDLSDVPPTNRQDEIGVLHKNFEKMIEDLRIERDLKESRMRELSTLFEISNAVNFITDSEELLKFVLTNAIEILEAERGSIMLLDDQTDELMVKVASGGRFSVMASNGIKLGHGICGSVAVEGKGRICNLGHQEQGFKNFGSLIPVEDIKTLLCSPLKFKEGTIGVINIVNKRDGENFQDTDLALLNLIASQAAVTIENNKLYELSITDGLTKLFVHRYFAARLSEELLRARRYGLKLTLIMIDIDNFKNFNDVYGHQVGDQVLQRVAQAIREAIRLGIDIPCRYGGEEMAIILPETRAEEAFGTAERLRESIAALTISHPLGALRITCSLGIASYPNDAHDYDSLVRIADKAMYFSKRAGKNRSTPADKMVEPEAT
jgi:diguanylate cyclase (GGDEF)-like protein